MLDEALEWLFEKVQGLGFAAAFLASLVALSAAKEGPWKELILTLGIWVATLVAAQGSAQ
jgi:hypothetical protein